MVLWRARPSTDTGRTFWRLFRETAPFRSPFTRRKGIRRTYSHLKPPGPHGELPHLQIAHIPKHILTLHSVYLKKISSTLERMSQALSRLNWAKCTMYIFVKSNSGYLYFSTFCTIGKTIWQLTWNQFTYINYSIFNNESSNFHGNGMIWTRIKYTVLCAIGNLIWSSYLKQCDRLN